MGGSILNQYLISTSVIFVGLSYLFKKLILITRMGPTKKFRDALMVDHNLMFNSLSLRKFTTSISNDLKTTKRKVGSRMAARH